MATFHTWFIESTAAFKKVAASLQVSSEWKASASEHSTSSGQSTDPTSTHHAPRESEGPALVAWFGRTQRGVSSNKVMPGSNSQRRGQISNSTSRSSLARRSRKQASHKHIVNTYLQLVGREILQRAVWLQPLLATLPCTPPLQVTVALFVAPFMTALDHALTQLLASPSSCTAAIVDEPAAEICPKSFRAVHNMDPSVYGRGFPAATQRSPMTCLLYTSPSPRD